MLFKKGERKRRNWILIWIRLVFYLFLFNLKKTTFVILYKKIIKQNKKWRNKNGTITVTRQKTEAFWGSFSHILFQIM